MEDLIRVAVIEFITSARIMMAAVALALRVALAVSPALALSAAAALAAAPAAAARALTIPASATTASAPPAAPLAAPALPAVPPVASASAPTATPSPAARAHPTGLIVNMRDVEIAQVAEQVSRITGRTLILDPGVKGMVNVVATDPLPPDSVWDLFQSVLRGHGFAAVRSGAAWRIVAQASAIQGVASAATGHNAARMQDIVTRVVPLRNLPADVAVRVFRPLVPSFGSIEALAAPNAIVVTDYAENVRRIERLVQQLDGGGGAFDSLPLKYASAKDVGAALTRILGDGSGPGSVRIAVDERTNLLLVRGDARGLADARRLTGLLDKAGGTALVTRVFRLDFADAESITNIVRGLARGSQEPVTNPVARTLARSRGAIGAGSTNRFDRALSAGPTRGDRSSALGNSSSAGSNVASNNPAAGDLFDPASEGASPFSSSLTMASAQTDDLAIQPAPELNAIIVRGTPAAVAAVAALIADLDVRRPQVLIEAAIAEVTGDAAEQLGIQIGAGTSAVFGGVTGGTSFANTGVSLGSVIAALLPGTGALLNGGLALAGGSRGDFSVLVQALGTSVKANLLSTPSITTLDNEPAEIVVGQNVPFRTGSFSTNNNSLTPFTTIERQDVGITLRVIPRIHEGDSIRLEVSQEVSSLVGSVSGAADLVTNRRSIQTTVLADDGDTIVLGGLISDDRGSTKSQVPLLGDIPVVGNLFKSRQVARTRRTLFVFLRPTILRDRASVVAAAEAKYARLRAQESGDPERGLLLRPPAARLPLEIQGIY